MSRYFLGCLRLGWLGIDSADAGITNTRDTCAGCTCTGGAYIGDSYIGGVYIQDAYVKGAFAGIVSALKDLRLYMQLSQISKVGLLYPQW